MIKLEVEDYCRECPAFEPDVDTTGWYDPQSQEEVIRDTIIRCRYRKRCANMVRYLERELKKNARNEDRHSDSELRYGTEVAARG